MDVGRVTAQIEKDFEGEHLGRLLAYIRQPSVSALNLGLEEMAALLAEEIREAGGEAQVVATAEFPVVFGSIDAGAERTLLFHGLYDVTPAEEPNWIVSPFGPEIRELEDLGRCVIGRGAEDMKSGIAAAMNMIFAAKKAGESLPVNLMFVHEASELGSGGLKEFFPAHKSEMQKADAVHWLWPMARKDGAGIVPLSLKGNLMGRLICRSGEWGGPLGGEIHALNANWVGNPAERLAEAIAHLERRLGEIYENGEGWRPSESQERLAGELAAGMDPEAVKAGLGVKRFRQEDFGEALRAHCFRPEFTVTGLRAGFVGEGKAVKVSMPAEAEAVVNMRFQPGEDPDERIGNVRKILAGGGFGDIEFVVNNHYAGGGTEPEHPVVQCFLGAHRATGPDPEVWPVHPAGMPVSLWTEELGLPWVGGIPCHAAQKHAANEYCQVAGLLQAEKFLARFLEDFSKIDL
jgi:acetylornithine deacetylase/succinyl-diaminopimelate desuccinylase-like protein